MDDIRQTALDRFRAYLERRQFSAHTVASYTLDLHLFFAEVAVPLAQVSFREVDQFVEHQHQHGRAWATINRRLNALKHFFGCVPPSTPGVSNWAVRLAMPTGMRVSHHAQPTPPSEAT